MTKIYAFSFMFVMAQLTQAQPTIQWQKTLGGSSYDEPTSIVPTKDGGYIVAGHTASNNGDVVGNKGSWDLWVVKLSSNGVIEWKKTYGGSDSDDSFTIRQTPDGGYFVAGATLSNDGDVSGNHGGSLVDGWALKLNASGGIVWQHTYGGTGWDEFGGACITSDGGFIVVGRSNSTDGDVTTNKGGLDYWVVKLDSAGAIIWQKTFGGTNDDIAHDVIQTSDGGFLVSGETASYNGDINYNYGNLDYWILKLSPNGELEWQNTYGGYAADVPEMAIETRDSNYVVIGVSGSFDSGLVTGHRGLFDYWVIKINTGGELIWQKSLGGTDNDWGRSILQKDDGSFIAIGSTVSTDGDLQDTIGGVDVWLLKLSESGNLLWQKQYGGSRPDKAYEIKPTSDGGYIFCAAAWSSDGDVTSTVHGYNDYWIVKLSPETSSPTIEPEIATQLQFYPNPARDRVWVEIPSGDDLTRVVLTAPDGKVMLDLNGSFSRNLDVSALPVGLYLVSASGESGRVYNGKLEVVR